jgi:hypothetical protein
MARFDTITDDIIKKTKQAADTGAKVVQAEAQKSINRTSPGSRKATRRGKEVKVAPKGKAPNTDTGNLVRNIKLSTATGTAMRGKGYYAVVRSVAKSEKSFDYAKHLEKTHPYMAPALKKSERTIKRLFKNAVKID